MRLTFSVKVWNPPRCNLRILDLTNNKNLQRLARLKLNKNQGSVKNKIAETLTENEPVIMAPKLHTSQIFKGCAYEPSIVHNKCRWILFKLKTSKFTLTSILE